MFNHIPSDQPFCFHPLQDRFQLHKRESTSMLTCSVLFLSLHSVATFFAIGVVNCQHPTCKSSMFSIECMNKVDGSVSLSDLFFFVVFRACIDGVSPRIC